MRKLAHTRVNRNKRLNDLQTEDNPVHGWYRFVLSYPPHLVREYLEKFEVDNSQTVLDPFCGTGTTLVECKKLGIPSIGIEANPVAYFASKVKTNWDVDAKVLRDHAQEVVEAVEAAFGAQGIIDDPLPSELYTAPQAIDLRGIPADSEKLLLKDSISPLPLHKTLVLLEQIENRKNVDTYDHERLALAKALVSSISNLHFGPEVGVGPAKADAPVLTPWLTAIFTMADDLRTLVHYKHTPSTVYLADARELSDKLPPSSIDVVITSPPYPNEKDYTRITRLEAVLLGFAKNKAELQTFKRTLMRSNTRNVYKGDDDAKWVADLSDINQLAETIEARRIALRKTSGFERLYATVTRLYFGGIARHLAGLRSILRPNARLAYVVGDQASYLQVMIRTGQIIEKIAMRLGYEATGIDLFRTRLATATREQLREEVVTLRWPGI